MKNVDVLLGLQWGDEGKGKVVDVLAKDYDIVARFQGGPNAGHTLEMNNSKFVLHTIPSGIFHNHTINVIGNGVVIDPVVLKREVDKLSESGVEFLNRLYIAKKAHLILPTHRLLDKASELSKGKDKIGSTLKGIGPAYMDKTGRNGLRIGDLFDPSFDQKYEKLKQKHLRILENYGFEETFDEDEKSFFEAIHWIKQLNIIDSEIFIHQQLSSGKKILAEGAQGTLLDIDFGSYPFVTSSNTITAGALTGLGLPPKVINNVYGIFKAYCTRVGSGPFPTELTDETGEWLRQKGKEFGSTTGRPRRCGWLDLPALKYAVMINGVSHLMMMKADVLSGLDYIKVCIAYEFNGKKLDYVPFEIHRSELKPVYVELPGWKEDVNNVSTPDQLPENLSKYIQFIEKEVKVPIGFLSVGPDRTQSVVLDKALAK
ncbi:MAG: adenylosuccinate synthetase [Vicingaceae bacterium]|nr:MAG: adenylosuccinate synthetase [Vicingaceae bacterium]